MKRVLTTQNRAGEEVRLVVGECQDDCRCRRCERARAKAEKTVAEFEAESRRRAELAVSFERDPLPGVLEPTRAGSCLDTNYEPKPRRRKSTAFGWVRPILDRH